MKIPMHRNRIWLHAVIDAIEHRRALGLSKGILNGPRWQSLVQDARRRGVLR